MISTVATRAGLFVKNVQVDFLAHDGSPSHDICTSEPYANGLNCRGRPRRALDMGHYDEESCHPNSDGYRVEADGLAGFVTHTRGR
ncbi:hypothetical protein QRX60_32150 [Amycolatopsis mongoliensis]|uniref:Uncharacterized protein n=1 Tax=Amycolatopsis mongoliensis TaxID=715475 RepID=A0A9Y2JII9_9PSEU|nr:hypothetical protein [Amycolatopsis sp. 4-36]WIX98702.1 hypothetical protein QRX60_32150 [Amycolatopsis sp. 4-36]